MSRPITEEVKKEAFEDAFKEELRDGADFPAAPSSSQAVMTFTKEIPVFDLTNQ